MYRAILTKYLPVTNTKPSRVKAYDDCGNSIIVSYDDDISNVNAHIIAFKALCEKMEWHFFPQKFAIGSLANGFVFVFVE